MFCRFNAGILTLCERQTKVYSLSFWILSIFCCRIIIQKTIKSNKLFLRNQYLVNPVMCLRTRCVLYFAFQFLWSNFKYVICLPWIMDVTEIRGFFSYLSKDNTTDFMLRIYWSPSPSGLTNLVTMKIVFLHGLQIASKISEAFVSYADTVGSPSDCKLYAVFLSFFFSPLPLGENLSNNTCTPTSWEANFSIDL